MGIGVVLWSLSVAAILKFKAELVVELITIPNPLVVSGSILISVGLLGAFGQTILETLHHHFKSHYDEELTQVSWRE